MRGADLDEIDRIIGQNMALYRTRKGFTPKQFGDLLGMTRRQIERCEKGKSPLPASRLPIVCEALNIRLVQFLGAEEI